MENEQSELGILLVDDEAQTLKYFRRAFEKEFRIFTATSADEGMGILKEHSDSIAILITDQRMPEKRGVELLKFARNDYSDIVRILTTGYTDLEEAIEAVNSGEIHRYITKPWDLSALQLELRQSMQFFLIRQERDELLREKLSARQRMEGVNRVRELVAMASGFTASRNPMLAVQSFLEQIPVTVAGGTRSSAGGWSEVLEDVETVSTICSKMVSELEEKGMESFSQVSLDTLISKIIPDESLRNPAVELGDLGPSKVEVNLEVLAWAVEAIISSVSNSSEMGGTNVICSDNDDRVEIQISVDGASWNGVSILDFPVTLLGAYFVCAHHYGNLNVGFQKGRVFTILIELPKSQAERAEPAFELSWLERVLSRFENW